MNIKTPNATHIFRAAIIAAGLSTLAFALFLAFKPEPQHPHPSAHAQIPVLTEFGDFQCPHCANFAFTILPEIQQQFIDTGLIRFEYRHYPFLGEASTLAAHASECARDQQAFSPYHYQIFQLVLSDQPIDNLSLSDAAASTGLDLPVFHDCMTGNIHEDKILQDRQLARTLGVRGTPSLFINQQPIRWTHKDDLLARIRQQVNLNR